MYEIHTSAKYKKQRKKLSQDDRDLLDGVIFRLAFNLQKARGYFSAYLCAGRKP